MSIMSSVQYFHYFSKKKKRKKEGEKEKINLLREDCIGNLDPNGGAIKKSDHACIGKERSSSGKKVCQSG